MLRVQVVCSMLLQLVIPLLVIYFGERSLKRAFLRPVHLTATSRELLLVPGGGGADAQSDGHAGGGGRDSGGSDSDSDGGGALHAQLAVEAGGLSPLCIACLCIAVPAGVLLGTWSLAEALVWQLQGQC